MDRRVLAFAPFDPAATRTLAALLRKSDRATEADRLCDALADNANPNVACVPTGTESNAGNSP